MADNTNFSADQPYTLDELLIDLWQDTVRPLLLDKSNSSRAVKAGIGAIIGVVTGLAVDGIVKFVTGKEIKIGAALGAMGGGAAGWFTPELSEIDWSRVTGVLDPKEWEEIKRRVQMRVLSLERRQQLDLLGLSPTSTWEEFQTAYREATKRWHPDRNPDDPESALRMVAILKAKEALEQAYQSGELPL